MDGSVFLPIPEVLLGHQGVIHVIEYLSETWSRPGLRGEDTEAPRFGAKARVCEGGRRAGRGPGISAR